MAQTITNRKRSTGYAYALLNADARPKIFAPWDMAVLVDDEFDDIGREEEMDLHRQARTHSACMNGSY